jgi:hypothetical protein
MAHKDELTSEEGLKIVVSHRAHILENEIQ